MPNRIVEVGRLELKGAQARFKQLGTLEASDRNVADLSRVLVRVTPLPELRLFADLVFPGEIFRVYQEATLVNYKDFLPQVEFSGIDNFRALIRYVTAARPAGTLDLVTREFAEKKGPAERFVSRDEMKTYQEALLAGTALPSRAAVLSEDAGSIPRELSTSERKVVAEQAWKKFAVEISRVRAEEEPSTAFAGISLAVLGATILFASLLAMKQSRNLPENAPNVLPMVGLGAVIGMALLTMGLLYVRKKKPR